MTPSTEARRIADSFPRLSVTDLLWLRDRLRDMGFGGEGGSGVREPRHPIRPLDARGVALDSEQGKADTRA